MGMKMKKDTNHVMVTLKIEGEDFEILQALRGSREFWGLDNKSIINLIIHGYLQDSKTADNKPVGRTIRPTRPVNSSADEILEKLAKKTADSWQEAADKERAMDSAAGFLFDADE